MIRFYLTIGAGLVAITAEACSCVAIIWTLASRGQQGLSLGLCLGGSALVPFVAQRLCPELAKMLARAPAKVLVAASAFGALSAVILMLTEESIPGLYVTASFLAVIHFISSQAIEMLFSLSVLEDGVEAQTASRMLQMVMTFGGCFGGLVAGTLIDRNGVASAALAAGVCYAFAGLPMLCLASMSIRESESHTAIARQKSSQPSGGISLDERASIVRQSLVALIACAVSVGCFNVCLPYMASSDKAWSATIFGVIDACGGLGAVVVLLALGGRSLSRFWSVLAPITFLFAGLLLGLSHDATAASICALFWGIAMNIVRARARTAFFKISTDVAQASRWTARLVLTRVTAEAFAPILAGILLDHYTPTRSYLMMMGICGGAVLCFSPRLYFSGIQWRPNMPSVFRPSLGLPVKDRAPFTPSTKH